MWDEVFVVGLGLFFTVLLRWAFAVLPHERWQIMASVPTSRGLPDSWKGMNLTYYGVLISAAIVTGVALILVLLGAIGVPQEMTVALLILLLSICVPSSKIIAGIVEKKKHTITVGGASFLGMLITPLVIWGMDLVMGPRWNFHLPMLPTLAALAIGYGFGEGLGRLGCISFGCCYGKPMSQAPGWIRTIVGRHPFIFTGSTKKISYESGLDGHEVIPVQAMTSIICIFVGLVGCYLFLNSYYAAALVLVTVVTQVWRAFSETLRADYRGGGTISSYQIMAILGMLYILIMVPLFARASPPGANILTGLASIWDPAVILFLQGLGLLIFLYTGRSMVTGSTVSFHVVKERI